MEVRDKFSTIEQYDDLINTCAEIAREELDMISQLEDAEKNNIQLYPVITNAKYLGEEASDHLVHILIILIAKYSKGENMAEVRLFLPKLVDTFIQVLKYHGGIEYPYYLWTLSLIIIMGIEQVQIKEISKLISFSHDYLCNFLLKSCISSWEMPHHDNFSFKRPYQSTKKVIDLARLGKRKEAVKKLKEYLTEKWYRGNAEMGWYNDHKSKFNLHFGYWSFESGALVKILDLDDSGLKGVQYYPYDMVHWNENNK